MNLIGLDLETTGVGAEDRPVQIAVVQRWNSVNRVLINTLCNPCMPIESGASDVHGITADRLTNAPDYAIASWQAVSLVRQLQPDALVTFNGTAFDLPMLARCATEGLSDLPHLDVMQVAYRFFPTQPSHKLGNLYQAFVGFKAAMAHDAAADVIYMFTLLEALSVKIGMSLEDLVEDMKTPKPYSLMPIGKHKGKLLRDVPKGFATWLLGVNEGKIMMPDMRLSMELILKGQA